MFKNYLIIATRNILKHKTISLINIFGLTVSMSVCLLLLQIIMDQLSYDNFHKKKDRIYRVITERTHSNNEVWETATTPYPLGSEIEGLNDIELLTRIRKSFKGVAETEDSEIPFQGFFTDENFLKIFDYPLKYGDAESALSAPNSLILSSELAYKLFGEQMPLGKTVKVDEMGEFIVTAVMDKWPGKSHFQFDALSSVQLLAGLEQQNIISPGTDFWLNIYDSYIYFLLKSDANLKSIKSVLANGNDHYEKSEFTYEFVNQSLLDITPGRTLSNMPGFSMPGFVIYFLAALAFIVLLSATFNYANLSTARALNRAKEIGVRKVIGAKRKHVIAQFLIEAIIISLISFLFADLLRELLQSRVNSFLNVVGAPFSFKETPNMTLIFIGFAILAGSVAGVVPAFFFSSTSPLQALKKNIGLHSFSGASSKFNLRKILMVVQFGFSVFFIITVVTIYRQSKYVLNKDYGYTTKGLISIPLNGINPDNLKNDIELISSVDQVGLVSHLPALGSNSTFEIKKVHNEDELTLSYFFVDENYIDNLELELLHGHNFPVSSLNTEQYAILNETAVKALGYQYPQEAIGESLNFNLTGKSKNDTIQGTRYVEIIGIVADHNFQRLDTKITPMALRHSPNSYNYVIVKTHPDKISGTVASINDIWNHHTKRPFEYQLYSDEFWKSNGLFDLLATIMGYIAFITISIASLGLLGMVIFYVQNRIKEIGVRKVLGASGASIMMLVAKKFVTLILISFIIGGPLAYFVNESWLSTYPYRISFGLETIAFGFIAILILVTTTIAPQVIRAINVNPAQSLRDE